jgi:hypothetical protein
MKKSKLLLVAITIFVKAAFPDHLWGSSRLGGDIYWECNQNPLSPDYGKLRFYLSIYLDCSAGVVPQGPNTTLTTNIPGLTGIPMSRDSIFSVVNNCTNVCRAVHRYVSSWTVLPGMPPANGWRLSWSVCCRSPIISNISDVSASFVVHAEMFAPDSLAGNYTPGICYDSSPIPMNYPQWSFCTNETNTFQFSSHDWDRDSIWYSFAPALRSLTAPVNYAPLYGATNPLPGPAVHPNNLMPAIDGHTGVLTFRSTPPGIYTVVVQVESYRHGQVIARNFIEFAAQLNNCPPPSNAPQNRPPELVPTIAAHSDATWQPILGTPGDTLHWLAEVQAGGRVAFHLSGIDRDTTNGQPQLVKFSAWGAAISPNFSAFGNCLVTPCASILADSSQLGFINPSATHILFDWVTTCDMLDSTGMGEYEFFLQMEDDHCPVGASSVFKLVVRISPGPALNQEVCAVSIDQASGYPLLSWDPTPGAHPNHYLIGRQNISAGTIDMIGPLSLGVANSYLDTTASPMDHRYNYYILTDYCGTISERDSTNSHTTMRLTANTDASGLVTLSWSAYQGLAVSNYRILRSTNRGPFSQIGTVLASNPLNYTDFLPPSGTNVYVVAIDGPNCSPDIFSNQAFQAELSVGAEPTGRQAYRVFPNPTTSQLQISGLEPGKQILFMDLTGKVLHQIEVNGSQVELDLVGFSCGVYLVQIIGEHSTIWVTKVIKQK